MNWMQILKQCWNICCAIQGFDGVIDEVSNELWTDYAHITISMDMIGFWALSKVISSKDVLEFDLIYFSSQDW